MRAVRFSETPVNVYRKTWRYITDVIILHTHCFENFRSNVDWASFRINLEKNIQDPRQSFNRRKWHNYVRHNLYFSLKLLRWRNESGWDWRGLWYEWAKWEMCTQFQSENWRHNNIVWNSYFSSCLRCFISYNRKKVKLFLYQAVRPIGLWDVETPTFFRQSAHRLRWGCQPYPPAALYAQKDSWYSFLLEAESTPGP
jgi:hypothetical protein